MIRDEPAGQPTRALATFLILFPQKIAYKEKIRRIWR
jgi:hypothetical protein